MAGLRLTLCWLIINHKAYGGVLGPLRLSMWAHWGSGYCQVHTIKINAIQDIIRGRHYTRRKLRAQSRCRRFLRFWRDMLMSRQLNHRGFVTVHVHLVHVIACEGHTGSDIRTTACEWSLLKELQGTSWVRFYFSCTSRLATTMSNAARLHISNVCAGENVLHCAAGAFSIHTHTPWTLNVPTAEASDSGKLIFSEHGNIFNGVSGLQIYEIRGHTSTGSCPKMQVLMRKDDEQSSSILCDLVQGHTTQQSQQGAWCGQCGRQ